MTISGRALALGLVVVLAGAGCSRGDAEQPAAILVDEPGGASEWGFAPDPRETLLFGTAPLRVVRPVTLESLSLRTESGDLQLLESRVSLFACRECPARPGLVAFQGYAGSACSREPWPPAGYGPSYPLGGFQVSTGDRPSLLLYLKPGSPRAVSGPITLTYRDGDKTRTLEIRNERINVEPPTATAKDTCEPSLWFGSGKDPDSTRITTYSPSPSP